MAAPPPPTPALLWRLLGALAAGTRGLEPLGAAIEAPPALARYLLDTAAWLGLYDAAHARLTPAGLAIAFAPPARRARLYAEACWRVPLVRVLLGTDRDLPDEPTLAARMASPAAVDDATRRRARAIRALLAPCIDHRPGAAGAQLALPFAPPAPPLAPPPADLRAGPHPNPDLGHRVLDALLDHGELHPGHLRAVLDLAGQPEAPLGEVIAWLIARGEAVRVGDALVPTAAAARRAPALPDAWAYAAAEPGYRAWLSGAAAPPPPAAARVWARWDLRFFGGPHGGPAAGDAPPLAFPGLPLAVPTPEDPGPRPPAGPFAFTWSQPDQLVAFPRALARLGAGLAPLHEALARHRASPAATRLPGLACPRTVAHGGPFAPGAPLPRTIPDLHTLRARLLTDCPAFTLLAASLLDRRPEAPLRVEHPAAPTLRHGRRPAAPLLPAWAAFLRAHGQRVLRPPDGGLDGASLLAAAEALGVITRAGERLVLDERLFATLHDATEERPLLGALTDLGAALAAFARSAVWT